MMKGKQHPGPRITVTLSKIIVNQSDICLGKGSMSSKERRASTETSYNPAAPPCTSEISCSDGGCSATNKASKPTTVARIPKVMR